MRTEHDEHRRRFAWRRIAIALEHTAINFRKFDEAFDVLGYAAKRLARAMQPLRLVESSDLPTSTPPKEPNE